LIVDAHSRAEDLSLKAEDFAQKSANSRANGNEMEAEVCAQVSQAHSLAAIALVLSAGSVVTR